MVSELFTGVALGSFVVGAIVSTLKGYWDAPQEIKYSFKKLFGSLLLSAFAATSTLNIASMVAQLPDDLGMLGWVGLVITYALFGFGIDTAHTALKK